MVKEIHRAHPSHHYTVKSGISVISSYKLCWHLSLINWRRENTCSSEQLDICVRTTSLNAKAWHGNWSTLGIYHSQIWWAYSPVSFFQSISSLLVTLYLFILRCILVKYYLLPWIPSKLWSFLASLTTLGISLFSK